MALYNFKKFFPERDPIHNNEWITNGHFLIKKSVLRKSHINYINSFQENNELITNLLNNVLKSVLDKAITGEFIPSYINNNINIKAGKQKIKSIVLNDSKTCLNAEYYHFLKSLNCTLYITGKATDPLIIKHNDDITGILLPIKSPTEETINNSISYDKWQYEQETIKQQKKQQKKEESKNNKIGKCVHFSGIEKKQMVLYKEIEGRKYYALKNKTECYDMLYTDIEGFQYPLCNISYIDKITEALSRVIEKYGSLKNWIEEDFILKMNSDNQTVSIGVAEVLNRKEEAIKHNRDIIQANKIKSEKEKQEREEQEQKYILEKNNKAEYIILTAEQNILNNNPVQNEDITIYESRYEYKETSLILYLMKKYNIKIPLKTQGWINQALANIYYSENSNSYTYRYYTSSVDSTVFYKYLDQLVKEIKKECKLAS